MHSWFRGQRCNKRHLSSRARQGAKNDLSRNSGSNENYINSCIGDLLVAPPYHIVIMRGVDGSIPAASFSELQVFGQIKISEYVRERISGMFTHHMTTKYTSGINYTVKITKSGE